MAAEASRPGCPLGCALCCVHRAWRGWCHDTVKGPHGSAVCPRQKLGFEYGLGALGLGYLLSFCSFTSRTHNPVRRVPVTFLRGADDILQDDGMAETPSLLVRPSQSWLLRTRFSRLGTIKAFSAKPLEAVPLVAKGPESFLTGRIRDGRERWAPGGTWGRQGGKGGQWEEDSERGQRGLTWGHQAPSVCLVNAIGRERPLWATPGRAAALGTHSAMRRCC